MPAGDYHEDIKRAEKHLQKANDANDTGDWDERDYELALAQVFATLAVATKPDPPSYDI